MLTNVLVLSLITQEWSSTRWRKGGEMCGERAWLSSYILFQCRLLKKKKLQQWQRSERLRFKREDLDLCPQLRLEDKEGQWEESQLVIWLSQHMYRDTAKEKERKTGRKKYISKKESLILISLCSSTVSHFLYRLSRPVTAYLFIKVMKWSFCRAPAFIKTHVMAHCNRTQPCASCRPTGHALLMNRTWISAYFWTGLAEASVLARPDI